MEHNCAIIDDKTAFRYRAAAIISEWHNIIRMKRNAIYIWRFI